MSIRAPLYLHNWLRYLNQITVSSIKKKITIDWPLPIKTLIFFYKLNYVANSTELRAMKSQMNMIQSKLEDLSPTFTLNSLVIFTQNYKLWVSK